MKQLLAARDAQFNNAALTLTRAGVEFVEPLESDRVYALSEVPYELSERIVVRNHEITLFSDLASDSKSSKSGLRLTPHVKWTDRDGVVKEFISSTNDASSVVTYVPAGESSRDGNTKLWKSEFSLGFGFGKRMHEAVVLPSDGELTHLQGTLQLSDKEAADFDIFVDRQYIVRSAHIRSGSDKSWFDYNIETKGTHSIGGFDFAESGTFKSEFCIKAEGNVQRTPRQRFEVKCSAYQPNLSNADYNSLTEFAVPPQAQVIDRYHITKTRVSLREGINWRLIGVLVNVVLILAVGYFVWRRRRRWNDAPS